MPEIITIFLLSMALKTLKFMIEHEHEIRRFLEMMIGFSFWFIETIK